MNVTRTLVSCVLAAELVTSGPGKASADVRVDRETFAWGGVSIVEGAMIDQLSGDRRRIEFIGRIDFSNGRGGEE